MKNAIIQYYVEGEDEKKLVEVLKNEHLIKPGKVQVFNAISSRVKDARLMTIKPNTVVVLIFDTDVEELDVLNENIKRFTSCSNVSKVIIIPQIKNLEDELVRSCNIRNVTELLGSVGLSKFKSDFIREKNLMKKMNEKGFNMGKLWSMAPQGVFTQLENGSGEIKEG